MPAMPAIDRTIRSGPESFTRGRGGEAVSEIIIHHWGQDGQSHSGVANYLSRKGGNTSAHYVVSSGRINELVAPENTAWHAGNSLVNRRSIGIENRPEMDAGDLEATAQLIASLYRTYGVLHLRGHQDVKATACPGRWQAKLAWLRARALEINGQGGGTAEKPPVVGGTVVRVTASVLNVRQGPGTTHPVVGTVRKGEVFTITEVSSGWGRLKSGAGWISLDYTSWDGTTSPAPKESKVRVTASVLNIRQGPGTTHPVVGTVRKGEVFTITEVSSGWGRLKSGAGWISLEHTASI